MRTTNSSILPNLIAIACLLLGATAQAAVTQRGDANLDGVVDVSDISAIGNYAYGGGALPCPDAADVNGDGAVNVTDMVALSSFLYMGGSPPAGAWPATERFCEEPLLTCHLDELHPELSANGFVVVPDLTAGDDSTAFLYEIADSAGSVSVTQSPVADTVVVSPGPLTLSIEVTTGDGAMESCDILVNVMDSTAPEISLFGVADGDIFDAGEVAWPDAAVWDNDDDDPSIEIIVDGTEWDGLEISEPGIHSFGVRATDASGNVAEQLAVFQIREFPLVEPELYVTSWSCAEDASGYATIDAEVAMSTPDFYADELWLSSVSLWGLVADGPSESPGSSSATPELTGDWVNGEPIRIAGLRDPSGAFDPSSVQAHGYSGVWSFRFAVDAGDEVVEGCPTHVMLTGTARVGSSDEVDIEGVAEAAVEYDLAGIIAAAGEATEEEETAAEETTTPDECTSKWKHKITTKSDRQYVYETFDCDSLWDWPAWPGVVYQLRTKSIYATGPIPYGDGKVLNKCRVGELHLAGTVLGRTRLKIMLEESEEGCCGPKITCTAQPSFKAWAKYDSPGHARSAAAIEIKSKDCKMTDEKGMEVPLHALAKGGAQVGEEENDVVVPLTLGDDNNVQISIRAHASDEDEDVFSDDKEASSDGAGVTVRLSGTMKLDLGTDPYLGNGYAAAKGGVKKATAGLLIEAECTNEGQADKEYNLRGIKDLGALEANDED